MIQIGSIVSIKPGSRYGLVKESFVHGERMLFNIHYIDSMTGKLMKCPDSRCDGGRTCPIHGQNCTESQLVPFTQADIEYLVKRHDRPGVAARLTTGHHGFGRYELA